MNHRPFSALVLFLLLAAVTPAGWAQTCTVSGSTMDFGTLSTVPIAQTDVTATVNVHCTGLSGSGTRRVCVGINAGTGTGSSLPSPRYMNTGANTIQYQIYADAAHSVVWGTHLVAGADEQDVLVPYSGGVGDLNISAYGRIVSGQSPAVGTYTSTLSFTGRIPTGGSGCNSGNSGTGTFSAGSFQAKVKMDVSCSIVAAPISFGSVSSLASPITSTGSVSLTCTNGASYVVSLNAGSTTGNTVAARKMSLNGAGAGVIGYQLFQSPGFTTAWGDGTNGTATLSGTGNGAAQSYTINARVPAQATPAVGSYKDTVTAIVTF